MAAVAADPRAAWAEPVSQGGFLIEGDGSGYSYADGVLTVNDGADIAISMADGTTPASDRIVVAKNATATIRLNGVDITGASYKIPNDEAATSPIDLAAGATLTVILNDNSTNALTGGPGGDSNGAPGVHVPEGAVLIIQGRGSLSANGGTSNSGYGGVGIGGKDGEAEASGLGPGESCGTVIILTENVTPIGGHGSGSTDSSKGADIGGGRGEPDGGNGQGIRPVPGEANTYEVWGELTLPEGVTIPEGAILTGSGSFAEGSEIQQTAPSAPTVSNISQITDTSITLDSVTVNQDKKIQYACVMQDGEDSPPTNDSDWQNGQTVEDLIAATAYTVYARYEDNKFYQASPASPGLTVITAPPTSAVSINYDAETISFIDKVEVSPNSDFSRLFKTGDHITSRIALRLYVRAKVEDGIRAPIRGVTTVSIPPRPNHADGITAVNASAEGVNDGKITGVSSDMEYREENITTWTDCAGDTVENLAPGTYYVRTKAREGQLRKCISRCDHRRGFAHHHRAAHLRFRLRRLHDPGLQALYDS